MKISSMTHIRAELRIYFFGQPRFAIGETSFIFAGPPKALPLLAYVLLNRAAPLNRDLLAFSLWPDESEDAARANLRRHLHLVLRALPERAGAAWIIGEGDSLRWNGGADEWFDVAVFEALLKDRRSLPQAIDVYAGDLLPNLYDDWVIAHRDRLRNGYLGALDSLVDDRLRSRDFHAAVRYAEAMLACDPWRENALRQLMAARYNVGDRSGALAVFESFRRRLREEMEVEPMPETAALRDVIVRGEALPGDERAKPSARAGSEGSATAAIAARMRFVVPFVGRAREIASLRESWESAVEGRGKLVLVGGEAGIGKSRLAATFALDVEREGGRVLFGSTASPESAPYQAFADALRFALPLVAALRIEPVWLAGIAEIIPELRLQRSDLPGIARADAERDRLRFFESLVAALTALAKPRPVLLIVEDLHWAGEATIAALEFIAHRLADARVLVIATYREEETPRTHPLRRLRRRLQASGTISHLAPSSLDVDSVRALLAEIPALAEADELLAHALRDQSDGNPLFVAELVRDWIDRSGVKEAAARVPAVREAIAARLNRLSAEARACAEIAAVAGVGFDVELIREVGGWPEDQVLSALDELLDRAIVRETSGRARNAYAFRHQLIQATLYDAMPADSRVRRHRRTARAAEELYADRVDEMAADLARHYDRGDEPEAAGRWYVAAGERAAALYAHAEAEALATRGLELARDDASRIRLVRLREASRGWLGDRAGQRTDLDEFERLAAKRGDANALYDAQYRYVLLFRSLGDRDAEAARIARLSELAGDDPRKRARALLTAAEHSSLVGRIDDARAQANTALELFAARDDAASAQTLCLLAELCAFQGRFDEARSFLERARGASSTEQNRPLIARTSMAAAAAAMQSQHYQESLELSRAAKQLFASLGDREGEADALAREATCLSCMNQFADALRANAAAAEIFAAIGKLQGLGTRLMNESLLTARLGALEDAKKAAGKALEVFESLDDMRGQTIASLNLSALSLWSGDPAAAREWARKSLHAIGTLPLPGLRASILANLGAAERDLGEFEAAIAHMQEGLALRRGTGRPAEQLSDLADLAIAYLRAGKLRDAKQTADELLTIADGSLDAALWPHYIFWAAAQVYEAVKDSTRADELSRRAKTLLDDYLAALPDDRARASVLGMPFNTEIARAARRRAPRARRTVKR